MDIAISGLIVLILILPGTLFRKGYYSGEFRAQYLSNDFFSLLTSTLIPSIVLYCAAYPIIKLFGYDYDLETILKIFSSEQSIIKEGIVNLKKFESSIFLFHIILNAFSFFLGFFIRWIVIEKSYDTKLSFFQFQNIWHYLITARYLQTKGFLTKDNPEDVDFTFVEAIVNINDHTYLIRGEFIDYQLGKDGTLDLLILKNVQRKHLNLYESDNYVDIQGNLFILKYTNIHTLSFSFFQVDNDDDSYSLRLIE